MLRERENHCFYNDHSRTNIFPQYIAFSQTYFTGFM